MSFAPAHVILPFSLVHVADAIFKGSLAISYVGLPFSSVLITFDPFECALFLSHAVCPLAIKLPISLVANAVSVHLSIVPLARVLALVAGPFTFPMHFILKPATAVSTRSHLQSALSFLHIVFETAIVNVQIGPLVLSLAVLVVILELAKVLITICEVLTALSAFYVLL